MPPAGVVPAAEAVPAMTERPPFLIQHGAVPPGPGLAGAVVAIGNFDGVHRGHRAVIAAALARAQALGRPAAALTFEPHPRSFLRPQEPLFRLTDERAKLRLFAATGLTGAIVLKFDAALAEPPPEDFVNDILVERLGIAGAAIGFDFRFGKNRTGTPDLLSARGAQRGFAVDVVPAVESDGTRISSGVIREALAAGHVAEANRHLGYPWFVSGEVVHGDKRGRALGYPTANLRLDPTCGLRHGIYAVRVGIGERRYDGVASFGRRPMFDVGTVLLEVFLFDFSGDLYGTSIDVAFIEWIRHELNFETVDDLVRRMDEDSRLARIALERAQDAFPRLGVLPG
ncbi:MAG: riboflavin kinase / adenylyltransferase [Alphaproteobacteria bacterium]|jgi:riboflavin kinase/FMN adenylyltransferase|nr:riboflavin kinase / adenylyltransferase [Alphaproteobacteria bacterium]